MDRKLSLPKETPSKAALALAMGYRFLQVVELGEVQDFAALAKKLEVSRAWVSMRVELTFLAPRIQNAILFGISISQTIQDLGRIARLKEWPNQLNCWNEVPQGSKDVQPNTRSGGA